MTDRALSEPRYVAPSALPADPFWSLVRLLVLFAVAGVVLVPIVSTALGGLKSIGELRTNPFGLPHEWLWENYVDVAGRQRVWHALFDRAAHVGRLRFVCNGRNADWLAADQIHSIQDPDSIPFDDFDVGPGYSDRWTPFSKP